ncbi:MAG: hypothetical protein AVO35_11130 [Candidatus Aegiribacteria sp. MLS_C]|nr:MAG: hypothetical protein AVO35_11130 [Candidatus Aegiribacteria sp. MLS_C]
MATADDRKPGNEDSRRDWLTLDNAARIYPASLSDWSPDVYRLSATLDAPIRVAALQMALRKVFPRFPYFQVHLKRGLFWYYLQRDDEIPELRPLGDVPGSVLPGPTGSGHLLRVQAGGRTMAVDFSHVLTDGSGAMRFFGTLVTEYLRQRGIRVASSEPFLDPDEPPSPEEFEDAYCRYCDIDVPGPKRLSPAYHLPDPPLSIYRVITGRMPVNEVLLRARGHGASLTEYLVAVYMHALARVRAGGTDGSEGRGILRIEVPVDMRRFHPSRTMRNFSLYVSPEIDLRLGDYSFREIVQRVHHSMVLQADRRELGRQIARNVRAQRNPLVRVLPLFLKDLLLLFVRRWLGERLYSGVLTNLGRISVPEGTGPHIERFGLMLGPNTRMKSSCAVFSYGDELNVSFGSVIRSRETEMLFFRHISDEGVRVSVSERSGNP